MTMENHYMKQLGTCGWQPKNLRHSGAKRKHFPAVQQFSPDIDTASASHAWLLGLDVHGPGALVVHTMYAFCRCCLHYAGLSLLQARLERSWISIRPS